VLDFTGDIAYEYGIRDPTLTTNLPEGDTRGKLFEGPEGVVQLVVPPEFERPGVTLKSVLGGTALNLQVVPSAYQTPTRGRSSNYDITRAQPLTLVECTPEVAAAAAEQALPLRLVTRTASAKKARRARSLALTVRAAEELHEIAGELRRGKARYGKGSLEELRGTGRLRVKLSRRLTKGSYTLHLTGKVANGRPLSTSARLRIR
jgi:hypothetical protein